MAYPDPEEKLRNEYLRVFDESHDDVITAIQEMQRLADIAESQEWQVWLQIIKSRIERTRGNHQEALLLVDAAFSKEPKNPYVLLLKGAILSDLRRPDEAIEVYDRIIDLYKGEEEPMFQERVAKTLLCKSLELANSDRYREAFETQ